MKHQQKQPKLLRRITATRSFAACVSSFSSGDGGSCVCERVWTSLLEASADQLLQIMMIRTGAAENAPKGSLSGALPPS